MSRAISARSQAFARAAGRFLAGKQEQVFDETAHAGGGFRAGLEGGAVFVGGTFAFQDALGFGREDRDRRAQFVGGVGGELPLPLERLVQPVEGTVEHAAEIAEFAGARLDGDALVEIALRDARGGAADGLNGPNHAPGEPPSAEKTRTATTRDPARRATRRSGAFCSSSGEMSRPITTRRPTLLLRLNSRRRSDRAGLLNHPGGGHRQAQGIRGDIRRLQEDAIFASRKLK